jgi:hypothetical protein
MIILMGLLEKVWEKPGMVVPNNKKKVTNKIIIVGPNLFFLLLVNGNRRMDLLFGR